MDWSVRQSVDPVRRGVHRPGVSVSRSPVNICRDMLGNDKIGSALLTLCSKLTLKMNITVDSI